MSSTIYRGYDISKRQEDGFFYITMSGVFVGKAETEDAAMSMIDKWKREAARKRDMTFTPTEAELIVSCLEVRLLALRRKEIDGEDTVIERVHVLNLIKRFNAMREG